MKFVLETSALTTWLSWFGSCGKTHEPYLNKLLHITTYYKVKW